MLEILKFAVSGFWVFVGCFSMISMVLYFLVNGLNIFFGRILRMIMVSFRGWPPNHIDADGDWKKNNNE